MSLKEILCVTLLAKSFLDMLRGWKMDWWLWLQFGLVKQLIEVKHAEIDSVGFGA